MKKILVIEDNDLLRDNIEEILELEGFEVHSAENGQVGIDKARDVLPDLIVSDVNMPLVDGFGVLEALRADEATKTIPYIFLTVKKSLQDIRTGMNLGADDYLTKPFDITELVEAVTKRLELRDEIVAKENEKYDELKNAVGLPITKVIDEPLRKIERLADLIKGEGATLSYQEVSEVAALIGNSATRLRKEIVKILFFYRAQALKNNSEELNALRRLTTANTSEQITNISNEIAQGFGRKSDLFVHAEAANIKFPEEFLQFCIQELVENAFRYSARNCPVKVTGTAQDDNYQITIQDKGIGFETNSFDDLQPYAIHSGEYNEGNGLGLGLYDVKDLVTLFEGRIAIESEQGSGTAITMSLPTA